MTLSQIVKQEKRRSGIEVNIKVHPSGDFWTLETDIANRTISVVVHPPDIEYGLTELRGLYYCCQRLLDCLPDWGKKSIISQIYLQM